ncbi:GNAT family N-acetyltransferase [Egibacter rhizosphaerae]|uniref:GNAT family N-acetyltransferase n=1 Tax=Egibacter rhizosphaerae TaxID=1670831 RepID=UPI0013F14CAD|nr:GNAT family N-acetyltransferase [Egibacter rhizosphaerae]
MWPQVPTPPAQAVLRGRQRLHIGALGVWALSSAGPIILLIIAGTVAPAFAAIVIVGALVSSGVRWWRFTWHIDAESLVIEQGLLQRQRRVIPRERIQSVERIRRLRHRLFGVVELRVESVGGGTTEGQLDALDPEIADLVRTELVGRPSTPRPAASADTDADDQGGDDELVRMRPGDLVLAGLTGGRVGVVAALLGFASQLFAEQIDPVVEQVTQFFGAQGWVGIVMAVGGFLLAVFVLSVVATVFAYWDFRLSAADRRLHTTRGLLEQRSGTIPLYRLQSLRVEENLLRRPLGRATVKVEVAGRAAGEASDTSTVLPIGTRQEAFALVDRITGRDDVAGVELTPAPIGARHRRDVRAALATLAATVGLLVWQGPAGVAGLALAVPFALLGRSSYRALGRARLPQAIVARSGVFVRTTHVTPERSLQGIALSATPFQRRRRLATLELHIARSPGGGDDPALIDIAVDEGRRELVRLAEVADAAARRPRTIDGRIMRAETTEDHSAVHDLLAAAFGRDAEAELVESLRTGSDTESVHSLVVEEDGEVVAHALLVPIGLGPSATAPPGVPPPDGRVLAVAPIAVRPDRQRQGIGGRLVKRATNIAAAFGAHRIVAAGPVDFLEQFGFEEPGPLGLELGTRDDGATAWGGRWLARSLPADDGTARGAVRLPESLAHLHSVVASPGSQSQRSHENAAGEDPAAPGVVGEGFEPS